MGPTPNALKATGEGHQEGEILTGKKARGSDAVEGGCFCGLEQTERGEGEQTKKKMPIGGSQGERPPDAGSSIVGGKGGKKKKGRGGGRSSDISRTGTKGDIQVEKNKPANPEGHEVRETTKTNNFVLLKERPKKFRGWEKVSRRTGTGAC